MDGRNMIGRVTARREALAGACNPPSYTAADTMRLVLLLTLLLFAACATPEHLPRPVAVKADGSFEVVGLPRGGRFDAAALEALGAETAMGTPRGDARVSLRRA